MHKFPSDFSTKPPSAKPAAKEADAEDEDEYGGYDDDFEVHIH